MCFLPRVANITSQRKVVMEVRTSRRGMDVNTAKLDARIVRDIRERLTAGECGKAIASEFEISPQQVSAIKNRRSWAWVE